MAGADIVKTNGQETIDRLENRLRNTKLTKSEVDGVIAEWETKQGNLRRADNAGAARVAGEIIAQLQSIRERAE